MAASKTVKSNTGKSKLVSSSKPNFIKAGSGNSMFGKQTVKAGKAK